MGQAKRVREAAGQPGEHDLAAGEACRLVLDQASAGADIGDDQDEGDQSHRQQKHHAERPQHHAAKPVPSGRGLLRAAQAGNSLKLWSLIRKAWPSPRYSSKLSLCGGWLSGMAKSTRSGPIGV